MAIYNGIKMYPKNGHNTAVLDIVSMVMKSSAGVTRGYTKKTFNQRFRATQTSKKVSR